MCSTVSAHIPSLIPESHSHGNERRATFGLLVGIVGIMLLKVLAGE